jgi:hypothetical protein
MPRPNRKTVRVSANIPAVIIKKWEELQAQLNDYLPLQNRSQRIEMAILENIRRMEREISEGPGGGGKGKRPRSAADLSDTELDDDSPERWSHQADDTDVSSHRSGDCS